MFIIIDDYSHKLWPYFLKDKSKAFSAFKEWKVMIGNKIKKKVKKLHTDNGWNSVLVNLNHIGSLEAL